MDGKHYAAILIIGYQLMLKMSYNLFFCDDKSA